MANDRRIPGNPGSPTPAVPPPATDPTPVTDPTPKERTGRLVKDGGKLYLVWGNMRIPVEDVNIRGTPATGPVPAHKDLPVSDDLRPALEAAARCREKLLAKPGIAAVRAGYRFENGAITSVPAVVVAVLDVPRKGGLDKKALAEEFGLPPDWDGVPFDFEIADPYQRLFRDRGTEAVPIARRPRLLIDEIQATEAETELLEAVPIITYVPPPGGNLNPVTGAMTLTCHVSPDAGWRILEAFLQGTERKLHLGMYDFTAPHIYRTARTLLKGSSVEWQQVLGPNESLPAEDDVDSTKANDLTEDSVVRGLNRVGSDRFENAFAHVGSGKTFASAYHIKVAVRDDQAFWLSSGNWQSSNQPDIDFFDENADRQLIPRYNREWHVVCESAVLAKRFQRFLDHDFETASTTEEAAAVAEVALPELMLPVDEVLEEERAAVGLQVFAPQKFTFTAHDPLTVHPILTPDNYLEVVLDFLRHTPKRTLYFQNQSLNPIKSPTAEFAELMALLVKYSNDPDLDVRFIFRNIGPIRKKLESLQAAGFNMSRIRTQSGCHTKGIIVDSETILVGSHNITNQGVQVNRDASLLIRHAGIAQYYEKVFLHDWDKLAKPTIREESVPLPVRSDEAAALASATGDFVKLPFSYFEEE
jgi:hypothetical protein